MLTPTRLNELVHEIGSTKVLTVYHSARVKDPAMRDAWRAAIGSALQPIREELGDGQERAEFEQAATFLDDPQPPLGGVWGLPGWVGFLTADGPLYSGRLPVHPPTLAVWRDGPVITPYMRALKQHRPVIIALVDSRSATLYRYELGTLTALPELALTVVEDTGTGAPARSTVRNISHHAPRGNVDTEHIQRHRQATFRRLAATLSDTLVELSGDEGWILIGGTREWARMASDALPNHLRDRVMVSTALAHDERETGIVDAARRAATELRAAHARVLVDRVVEQSGARGRGAAGVPAVQRALRARSVDLLIATPEFLRVPTQDVEDMVRAALAQGAGIEVLAEIAAERLDVTAGGIAAQLRFAVDVPAAARTAGRQQPRYQEVRALG
ncbi:MAG TPA: hypothetical protein VIQ74_14645 [Gemmatimonadaceae bacterium]